MTENKTMTSKFAIFEIEIPHEDYHGEDYTFQSYFFYGTHSPQKERVFNFLMQLHEEWKGCSGYFDFFEKLAQAVQGVEEWHILSVDSGPIHVNTHTKIFVGKKKVVAPLSFTKRDVFYSEAEEKELEKVVFLS